MKAVRVTTQADGQFKIEPLALPTIHRTGEASPDAYRRQSVDGSSTRNFHPQAADFVRTIVLGEGKFNGLATQPGLLFTIVTSGPATLHAGLQTVELETGDVFLTDDKSASAIVLEARNPVRLVQLSGISPDFPGADAKIQPPGTFNPREGTSPNLKRIYKGESEHAHFAKFSNFFPTTPNSWSAPCPVAGFRMMHWENAGMDYHPCVVSQIGVFLSGEQQIDVRGGGGVTEIFRAGDICMSEDTKGEGHKNLYRGGSHTTIIVVGENNSHWPIES